jgi:DNA-binding LacI/PurR family transcriptional regulator
MTNRSRPTIVDVAKAADVSVATVSYVLSGKRPIGPAATARVHRAIGELRYRPNPNAQALKAVRNNAISVMVSDWRETIMLPMLQGAESAARERGYHLTINSTREFDDDLAAAVDHLVKKAIDGVLFVSGIAHEEPLDCLPHLHVPAVGVNRPISDAAPAVLCDNVDGGYRAARHLLDHGAMRPAIIVGPMNRAASRNRLAGFRRALAEASIDLPDELVFHGDFEAPSGARGLTALLAARPEVDSLFCTNDAMAAGAIGRATRSGIDVPGRVRVIGFDDQKFASLLSVQLSSFSLPGEEMARSGVRTLVSLIEGEAAVSTRVMVRSELHARESTLGLNDF